MFTVDIELLAVPDVDEWQEGLRAAINAALPAVGEALVEHALSCIDDSHDPDGTPYQPFSPNTARGRDPEAHLLIDRGFLRGSIHWAIDPSPDGQFVIVRVSAGGAAASYAYVHQWGTATVPQRRFFPLAGDPESPLVALPPDLEAEVVATLQQAIDQWVERENAAQSVPPPR